MNWVLLSVLAAFSQAGRAILTKKIDNKIDEYSLAFFSRLFAFLLSLPLLLFIEIPKLNQNFYLALIISGILLSINTVLYMKAFLNSDASITMPMVSFTPIFILILAPIIIKEQPNIYGYIGVILIVIGSYVLNIKERKNGLSMPFKKLLSEPGPKLMLIVAILWAFNANLDRIGINNSSPFFWVISINLIIVIMLLPLVIIKSLKDIKKTPKNILKTLPIGLMTTSESSFNMAALPFTLIAYVAAIKRISIIITVIASYYLFKEKNIKERLFGSIIMLIGVLFITLFN